MRWPAAVRWRIGAAAVNVDRLVWKRGAMFAFIDTTTIEDINRRRREMRREIAGMLRGARFLRRHKQRADAVFAERHAADLKACAGARPVPV